MTQILPRQRRVLLVVGRPERAHLDIDSDGAALQRRPGVMVARETDDLPGMGLRLKAGDFLAGRMYLQNPFDPDLYVEATDATLAFAEERLQLFVRLCQILGARKVERAETGQRKSQQDAQVGGTMGRGPVEIGGSARTRQELHLERRLRTQWEFPGSPPDLDTASNLLDRHGLRDDDQFASLAELRVGANALLVHEHELDLYRSARTVLDLSAALKIPSFLNLKGSYKESLQTSESFNLRVRVEFPPFA